MEHLFPFYVELIIVAFVGLVLGSFASALIYRIPRQIPIFRGDYSGGGRFERSSCVHCDKTLCALDLIPLFSWLSTLGRCRYCKASLSVFYPLAELSSLALCLSLYVFYDVSLQFWLIALLVPICVALFFIDLEHFILPDKLVFAGMASGLIYIAVMVFFEEKMTVEYAFVNYVVGGFVYFFSIWGISVAGEKILDKEVLGFGDVKFFGMAGLWLGVNSFPAFCILAGCLGIFFGLVWRLVNKSQLFPFGPALIVAFFLLLLEDGFLTSSFLP